MGWLKTTKTSAPQQGGAKVWMGSGGVRRPHTDYNPKWDPTRTLGEALTRVTWVYRCVDAIASNAARQPIVFRKDNPWKGELVENDALNRVLNRRANPGEDSFMLRYRLSGQVLLSNRGAFLEVVRDRKDEVSQLWLLPPDQVKPIPDPTNFVSGYEVTVRDEDGRPNIRTLKPEQVIWVRKPHPFDQYSALTPLEAAGVSIETDWLAKMYNRNFLLNDGRPGGMIVLRGEVMEEDKEELQSRFRGSIAMAGRITVVAAEQGADFVDTAVTPRDAQYIEGRKNTKEEILMAFGVPEPVIGNAAGRTFDNAEMERLIFWMETMMPHLEMVMRRLDILDGDDELFVAYDLSMVDVLQRMEMKRKEFSLREFDAGVTSVDEYREDTGREPIGNGMGRLMILSTTKSPYLTTDGDELELPRVGHEIPEELQPDAGGNNPEGRPETGDVNEEPEDEPRDSPEDDRTAPLENEPQKSLAAQIAYLDSLEVKEAPAIDTTEEDRAEFKSTMRSKQDLVATEIEAAVKRFLERQKRVVDEKLRGKKMNAFITKRQKYIKENGAITTDSPYNVSLKAAVEIVYDQAVWDTQLDQDLTPIIEDAIQSSAAKTADSLEIDFEEFAVAALVSTQMKRVLEINNTTRHKISEVLAAGALEDYDVQQMADMLDDAFDKMIEDRPSKVGLTEAVAAINAGRNAAGVYASGLEKVWVSLDDNRVRPTHIEADGQQVPVGDVFVVGGHKMEFPGDPRGPAEEVVNCRCSLAFSNGEVLVF